MNPKAKDVLNELRALIRRVHEAASTQQLTVGELQVKLAELEEALTRKADLEEQ